MRGDVVERPVAPFLGFGEQLPAVFGMKRGALAVQGFHRAAVNELFHRHLPGFGWRECKPGFLSLSLRFCDRTVALHRHSGSAPEESASRNDEELLRTDLGVLD